MFERIRIKKKTVRLQTCIQKSLISKISKIGLSFVTSLADLNSYLFFSSFNPRLKLGQRLEHSSNETDLVLLPKPRI